MIHHPPLSGLTSKHRALRDQTKMTQLIKDHAPHLVIYGHNHVHQVSAFQSDLHVTPIIGVGSASEKSGQSKTQGPSFNLYHLSHNTENWVLETRFYTHEESIESQKEFAPQQIWRYS